ncbi:MAG: dockerin type I repeat-containing protein [Ruminococcus sp.]|uniref:dockerin type I repeat-containing protein n=1 Tax=Ruminococcus sp. TaxID=41978 RepID=UPI0025F440F3|nr:dockerin type I repeat-containing protein [Ruminococcus sp.]MCR5600106.1 dockerin type I repeat-containing protein [Ruminococcus sp.]
MKKLMSFITSMAMTLCIVSIMLSAAVPIADSADDKPVLTAGNMGAVSFDGITVELDGDAILFTTEFENTEILVSTQSEIHLSRSSDAFIFRPLNDGRYVVAIVRDIPCEPPKPNSIWFPPVEAFAYEILINNSIVNIEGMHKLYESKGENYSTVIESFLPNDISFTNYGDFGSIFGAFYLNVCLSNGLDPIFLYYIREGSTAANVAEESMITSNEPNAEAWYLVGDKYERSYGNNMSNNEFPSIGKKGLPTKEFDISPVIYSESPPDGSLKIILCEDKKTKVYEIDYKGYDPVPSTLKKTECPENDINADGNFNIADVLQFQKYLLGNDDSYVFNWRAADMNNNGVLDVFDLIQLKKALIALDS